MSNEEVLVTNAVAVWKSAQERVDKMFLSFSDDDLLKEVAPERNRVIYLWGHLTAVHDRMVGMLGLGERVAPGFDAVFLTSPDKAVELPSVATIRETWKQVSERLNQGIAGLSVDEWLMAHGAVSAEDFAKDPLRNRFAVLLSRTNHLAYHLGQMTLVRR